MSFKVPSRKGGLPSGEGLPSGTISGNSPEHLSCELNYSRLGKMCIWYVAMNGKYGAQKTKVVISLFFPAFRLETIFEDKLRNLTVYCG